MLFLSSIQYPPSDTNQAQTRKDHWDIHQLNRKLLQEIPFQEKRYVTIGIALISESVLNFQCSYRNQRIKFGSPYPSALECNAV